MPLKVLIVDDDNGIRKLLGRFLEREGFATLEAENGLEGVETAKREQPDLIIMDVMMPQMDGLTAARLIKFYKPLSEVPIIFLTAKDAEKEIELAEATRAEAYVTKPFDVRQVIEVVKSLFEKV
ncbi:response regulator [bacterium]|nr:response regulator [bacterium]